MHWIEYYYLNPSSVVVLEFTDGTPIAAQTLHLCHTVGQDCSILLQQTSYNITC